MTAPLFADPSEVFLSGNTQALDNALPESKSHEDRYIVLGLAATFIAWRHHVSSKLKNRESVSEQEATGIFKRLFGIYIKRSLGPAELFLPGTADIVEGSIETLGGYLYETSYPTFYQAYQAELVAGTPEPVALERAATGFGLSPSQMKSWIIAQRGQEGLYQEPVGPSAMKTLDRQLLQRADVIGHTESWQMRQIGQIALWSHMEKTGQLPQGTQKKWVTQADEMVCPICGPLDGQELPIDEWYDTYSGKVMAPGVHPNCRCHLELSLPKFEGMLEKHLTSVTKNILLNRIIAPADQQQIDLTYKKPKKKFKKIIMTTPSVQTPGVISKDGFTYKWADASDDDFDEEHPRGEAGRFTTKTKLAPMQPAVKTNPLISTNPLTTRANPLINPLTRTMTNPLATMNPLTSTNPLISHNPLLARGTQINIPVSVSKAPFIPPEPDNLVFLPVDDYNDQRPGYGGYRVGVGALGGTDAQDFTVGQAINFDFEYSDRDAPPRFLGIKTSTKGGNIHHLVETIDHRYRDGDVPYDDDQQQMDQEEYDNMVEVNNHPFSAVGNLSDDEVVHIAHNLGYNTNKSMDNLRLELAEGVAVEDSDAHNAVARHIWEREVQFSADSNRETPSIFTFPDGYHGQDFDTNAYTPIISGVYRVSKVVYHPMINKGRNIGPDDTHTVLKGWNEIRLTPVEDR